VVIRFGEEKADDQQQAADYAGGDHSAICHFGVLVAVDVGRVIGGNENADNGEPERGHQDGACIDEITVQHLNKEQGRNPEVDG